MAPLSRSLAYCLAFSSFALATTTYPPLPLPSGVTASYVDTTNTSGLVFHYLSAGCTPSNTTKPLVLILHGYPEIAYGFKDLLVPIAKQGYCVVASDQRGYGRTTGWDTRPWAYVDLTQWKFENLVRDLVAFVWALGYKEVRSVIGHDFGTIPAGWAALTRPDIFQSVLHMSVPFVPPQQPPFHLPTTPSPPSTLSVPDWTYAGVESALEHLTPPRRNYQWYNSQPSAAHDFLTPTALNNSLHAFFRIEWFIKSPAYLAQFPPPHPLPSSDPSDLAQVPYFYIMLANQSVSQTLATLNYGQNASVSKTWFPDADVDVYVQEFSRTGFQGALNYYRVLTSPPGPLTNDGLLWAGRKITVPTFFLGGKYDWQTYIVRGALEGYNVTSTDFRGSVLLNGSGHWPYIEQTGETVRYINKFLEEL
ncbi:hypothetical protein M409DRAFT_50941 [Zasmidium cellare ATCC 36951]|uniref:AB hydrolase-1 domain-containing protein n=1 Tax=Zasmidium cellare ATCC 36951 TaxID=1080233 RepID=A0A6A6CWM5_ZASCE|nr:uncharacterized protein M409DRAFT_50941 [Zasmidium cellare ATCC 36951]KAF2171511.1 hypothetical protein M409DRAFT_50941 [Zasmidium cellare ATCC 36951]